MSRHGGARRRVGGVRTRGWGLPARPAMQRRCHRPPPPPAPAPAALRREPRPAPPHSTATAPAPLLPARGNTASGAACQPASCRAGVRRGEGAHGGEGGCRWRGQKLKSQVRCTRRLSGCEQKYPREGRKVPACYQLLQQVVIAERTGPGT